MVIDNTFHSEYSTIAGKLDYEIGFEYFTNPDNTPQLRVQLNGNDLSYGVDYTLSGDGLSIVLDSDPGLDGALIIRRLVPFTQTSDYTVGRIDPEQIEKDLDLMVMRDQELADYWDWLTGVVSDIDDYLSTFGDIVTHDVSEFVQKSGDTMTGALGFERNGVTTTLKMDNVLGYNSMRIGDASDGIAFSMSGQHSLFPLDVGGKLGLPERPWASAYIKKLNNGGDIAIPATAGTMALLSDLPTTAADVHALPDTTKYGATIVASIDPTTFVMTLTLKDQDGTAMGSSQTIDLPLESVVVSGSYDSATKEVVLTLESGSTIRFSVADLVSGLQTEITSLNMLDADLVDDSTSTNKFVTASEKSAISTAVQPGDLATVATSGDYDDLLNKPTIPDTTHMVTDNTAQNISAVKTFTAANPDSTTSQTIVANYAVKFGTSGNNDLFAISANANTNTLSIVGDNAANIIDIAASGAVLNHFQVTASDVTFGGNSLINPGVMTGADGVNAGASGLVPAPAATDNVNFLCGDGTWKAAGGGSYTAGTGISIDANNEISVTAPTLTNTATGGALSLTILGTPTTSATGFNIGADSQANGDAATAVGSNARAAGGAVALGRSAKASGSCSIQINASGSTKTNSDDNTFKVANANGNYEIMSADGTIPEARLADTTNAQQGDVLTLDSTGNAVWQASSGGLPSQTGQSGKFLTTDGTDASWSDKPLVNKATGTESLGILSSTFSYTYSTVCGSMAYASGNNATAVGYNSVGNTDAVAVGYQADTKQGCVSIGKLAGEHSNCGARSVYIGQSATGSSSATDGIAIGYRVQAKAQHAIQLGSVSSSAATTNSDANTFKVANANGNYEIMSADGTVPHARLTNAVVSNAVTIAVADWNGGTTCTKTVSGLTATSTVWVAPDNTSQSDYLTAGVYASAQTTDTITFTCTTTPTSSLTVNVVYC